MTEHYSSKAEFSDNSKNVESRRRSNIDERNSTDKNSIQEEKLNEYMRQLLAEKAVINEEQCPFALKFVDEEIARIQQKVVKGPHKDNRYIDIYHDRPMKISVKVLLPVKEHPRFNFVGKLLGPKGSTLKQLQEETMCYMNICGRGSMKDREKEDELRKSLEPKYAHLTDDLHVEISTITDPVQAHTRIASALNHVRKYLIPEFKGPDMKDEILAPPKSILKKLSLEDSEWEGRPRRSLAESEMEHYSFRKNLGQGGGPRSTASSKSTVMSILNKARIAMQESRNYKGRRPMESAPEYSDDEGIGYHPKMKRYHEGNIPYSKTMHDADFKKRKL